MRIVRWQDLEQEVQDLLMQAQRRHPLVWHRFTDTKAAGNFVNTQPGDFFVGYEGRGWLIECKFSEVHESLRSCFSAAVEPHQLASGRIWARAKQTPILLFYSGISGICEIWDTKYCADRKARGRQLELAMRRTYQSVEHALTTEIGYS